MSPSDQAQSLKIVVAAADASTEIFVVDGDDRLVGRGVARVETGQLSPGIYKIKARAGFETREQLVVLRDAPLTVTLPPFAFASPAPLAETSKLDPGHIATAERESRNVHATRGAGSSIFVFAREWQAPQSSDRPDTALLDNPASGLTLGDVTGTVLVAIDSTAIVGRSATAHCAACNVSVNPGSYRLSVARPNGVTVNQAIVAAPGWQTQVFLMPSGNGDRRSADLSAASILMARTGTGFQHADAVLRQTELARLGLANARKVLSSDLRAMLQRKFDNPMLGILAGHLLLLEEAPQTIARDGTVTPGIAVDLQLLRTVVTNLRMLVGAPHPDVEALALRLSDSTYQFTVPPMLRRSWGCAIDASLSKPDSVPADSIAAEAARTLTGDGPWLLWTTGVSETTVDRTLERAVRSQLRARRPQPTPPSPTSPFAAVQKLREADSASTQRWFEMASRDATATEATGATSPPVPAGSTKIGQLVRTLGLPRSRVERMLQTINLEVDDNADDQ